MKIVNDKYYTSNELAKYCIEKTYEIIGENNITEVIEPSAGNGSFSNQLDCIAYDIEPKSENIIQQNYLELDLYYKKGRLIIGNPPYGVHNYMSVKFYKKSVELGDYISFILPISQLNNNMYMYEFTMVHSEDLGDKMYSNRKIHCCLNIYKRNPLGINKKPNYDLKDVVLKTVNRGQSRNDKVPEKYDFSISGFGASVGNLCDYENQYCQQIYFTINNTNIKTKIIDIISNTDWKNICKSTATPKLKHWIINKYLKEQISEIS